MKSHTSSKNKLCPNREAMAHAIDLWRACHSTPFSQKLKVVVLTGTPPLLRRLRKPLILIGLLGKAPLITALA
jgi:hypothetical protein